MIAAKITVIIKRNIRNDTIRDLLWLVIYNKKVNSLEALASYIYGGKNRIKSGDKGER
jgi:hypothetical protein